MPRWRRRGAEPPASRSEGLLLGLALSACAAPGTFVDLTYRDREAAYRVGALPQAWRRVAMAPIDLVFHHGQGGVISASARCAGVDDVPLDVLTNHLLFGVERDRELSRRPATIDGRGALRTRLLGSLDGVAVELELVVLKKDGCTYDLQLVAGPQVFPDRLQDFEAFLGGFAQLARR